MNNCSIARENTENTTWTPEYRLQCEAAMLLRMPLMLRRMELDVPARAKRKHTLEAEMKRQWQAGRAS